MKLRKFINKIFAGSFAMVLTISFAKNNAHAAANNKLDLMYYGLKKINAETYNLKDMKKRRFDKLEKDLEEALNIGCDNVNNDSDFYLLNNLNFSAKELDYGLADTGLAGLGKDFKAVADKYGINPLLLMAMAKHETGNGTSELFREKNNLFGFNAIDHDPYNMATKFKRPKDSIDTVAKHLKEEYLDKNGTYFNGVSAEGIGSSYASDPDWSKKVNSMMMEIADKMIETNKGLLQKS